MAKSHLKFQPPNFNVTNFLIDKGVKIYRLRPIGPRNGELKS